MQYYKWIAIGAVLLLSSACASTTVVLLPGEKPDSKVIVSTSGGEQIIDVAGQMTKVNSETAAPTAPADVSMDQLKTKHQALFAAQPKKPKYFILYFERNSSKLKADSKPLLKQIVAAAADRKAPQVNIIGHSDAAGNMDYNLNLSIQRAKAVWGILAKNDIEGVEYHLDSHGENDPLIKSNRQYEPRNRRVEVQIW